MSVDIRPLVIQIRQRDELGVIRPRRIGFLVPRTPDKAPDAGKRRRWDARQPVRAGPGSVPEPGPGSSHLLRRVSVLGVFGHEEHSVGGYRDDDYRHGGFDLEPEDYPGGVDLAVDGVAAADSDDADYHGEDTEAEDGAEG